MRQVRCLRCRDQTAVLSAAVQAYGEALDPRLRRAPPLGLGSGLAHFTAPFLEVLGRSHEVLYVTSSESKTRKIPAEHFV